MPNLSVSPEGLIDASAALTALSGHAAEVQSETASSSHASTQGGSAVTDAIAAFSHAYSNRLTDLAVSVEHAASWYAETDEAGAVQIGHLSM
ncbi:MAG: hypothetical protein WBO08_06705 [Mycobacterium sp.]